MAWKIPKIKMPNMGSVKRSLFPSEFISIKAARDMQPHFAHRIMDLMSEGNRFLDGSGWIVDDCDAMLWQGIWESCNLNSQTLAAAEAEHGRYLRRPPTLENPECYASGHSKSTWSKDMAIGFFWWCWRTKDKRALYDHVEYGRKNCWNMGFPTHLIARVQYTPSLVGLLHKILNHLDGRNYKEALIPQLYPSGLVDFEAHLQVLMIALIGEMDRKIPKEAFLRLVEHFNRAPFNPLYASVLARFDAAYYPAAVAATMNPRFESYFRGSEGAMIAEHLFSIYYLCKS